MTPTLIQIYTMADNYRGGYQLCNEQLPVGSVDGAVWSCQHYPDGRNHRLNGCPDYFSRRR